MANIPGFKKAIEIESRISFINNEITKIKATIERCKSPLYKKAVDNTPPLSDVLNAVFKDSDFIVNVVFVSMYSIPLIFCLDILIRVTTWLGGHGSISLKIFDIGLYIASIIGYYIYRFFVEWNYRNKKKREYLNELQHCNRYNEEEKRWQDYASSTKLEDKLNFILSERQNEHNELLKQMEVIYNARGIPSGLRKYRFTDVQNYVSVIRGNYSFEEYFVLYDNYCKKNKSQEEELIRRKEAEQKRYYEYMDQYESYFEEETEYSCSDNNDVDESDFFDLFIGTNSMGYYIGEDVWGRSQFVDQKSGQVFSAEKDIFTGDLRRNDNDDIISKF